MTHFEARVENHWAKTRTQGRHIHRCLSFLIPEPMADLTSGLWNAFLLCLTWPLPHIVPGSYHLPISIGWRPETYLHPGTHCILLPLNKIMENISKYYSGKSGILHSHSLGYSSLSPLGLYWGIPGWKALDYSMRFCSSSCGKQLLLFLYYTQMQLGWSRFASWSAIYKPCDFGQVLCASVSSTISKNNDETISWVHSSCLSSGIDL